jgi:acyl carrier protein
MVVAARWARDELDAGAAPVLRDLAAPARRAIATATPAPAAAAGTPSAPAGLAAELGTLPPAAARARLLELVRGQVAQVLAFGGADDIDPDRAFTELGFDSLTVVELRNRLDAATGQRLPATLAFDHPTVRALAEYLAQTLLAAGPTAADALRDALDTVTRAVGDDPDVRHQVVAMLHGALGRLQDGTGSAGARLDAASDDELLAFLDEN